jgi:phosphocarrier protein HPr
MKPMMMIIHDDEDKAQIIRNSLKAFDMPPVK